ncbi:MAG: hypothetical protein AB199_02190 [Parcubacteria bacterium C7867-004]|nr:MAG: hypothetical protein AB199_02190 [Parcubacteria bacterium C7867-004]
MRIEELMLKNRDGKRMPATVSLPDGVQKGVAIILHGVGGWKDQNLHVVVASTLAEEGYAVFRFSESDAVTSPDGDFFHETMTQYGKDLEDAIAHLQEQSWFQGTFVLIGHSMGGLLATWYAARHTEAVSKLVLLAPAISWKMMWWGQLPFALLTIVRGHVMKLGIDGKKYLLSPLWWLDFFTFDGYAYARKIDVPTLIISAERDHTVAKPREHRIYTRFFTSAEHSTISWADHDFTGYESELADTIRKWLTSS